MGSGGGGEAAASGGGGGRALAAGDLSSIVIDEITGEPILAGAPGAAGPVAGAGGSGRRPGSTTGPRTMAELGGLAEQGRSGSSARLSTGGGGGLGASASTASKLPGAPAASGGTAPGGAKRGGTAGAAAAGAPGAAGGKAAPGAAALGSGDAGVTTEAPGSSRSQGQQLPTSTASAAQHSTTALRSVLSVRAWPGIPSLALREGVPAVTAGGTTGTPVVSSASSSAAAAAITPRLAAAAATIGAVSCRYTPWSRHAVRARDEAAAALAASLRGAQTDAVNALFADEAAATEEWVAVWVARVSSACAHLGLNYDALLPPPGSAQAMPAPPAVTPTGAGRPPSRGSSVGAAAAGKGSKPPASGAHLPPQGKR